eukprot:2944178-Pyramimonas_sp.AAC.1
MQPAPLGPSVELPIGPRSAVLGGGGACNLRHWDLRDGMEGEEGGGSGRRRRRGAPSLQHEDPHHRMVGKKSYWISDSVRAP